MSETSPTIPSLRHAVQSMADRFGDSVAQTFIASGDPNGEAIEISFAALADDIRARACALAALGIRRQDRVSLMTPLGPHGISTVIGAMIAATAAPLNYFLEAGALARLIEAAGSSALLIARHFPDDQGAPAKAEALRELLPGIRIFAYGPGEDIAGSEDFDAAIAQQAGLDWLPEHDAVVPDRVLALFHTGGTTGRPKLVPHTEAMYLAMLGASARAMGTTTGNCMMGGLPLFHTSGALQAGVVPLLNGCSVVIPSGSGFRGSGVIPNYWNFVGRFGVTVGASVPTILAALSNVQPERDVSTLKHVLCGAAPLPRSTIEAITSLTGGADVIEGWGMTETCGYAVLNPKGRTRVGSVGLPFEGVEAQIRSLGGAGEELPVDTIGELVVRGNIVITRYADERPDSFTNDGWLRTGDLARKQEDGYLWIVGRAKDVIIRGGHNIDPAIIEVPAYEHPAVELAAAVGRPDRYSGELPILFVQLRAGSSVDSDDLLKFVRDRIHERAAIPKAVHILATMPLSGPGKIHKVPLRYEAIRAVMQAEIDATLGDGHDVVATVVEDELSGTAVVLSGRANDCARSAELLSGYSYQIKLESRHD